MTIKDKLLDKIKETDLKPRDKWQFEVKNIVFWTLFVVSILIGGLAVSIIYHLMIMSPIHELHDVAWWHKLFMFIPIFWLVLLGVFIYSAFVNVTHTKSGYKFNHYLIVVIGILGSLILSFAFMSAGLNEMVEEQAFDHLPGYKQMQLHQYSVWMNPEQGRLLGIIETKDGDFFELRAIDRSLWEIRAENKIIQIIRPGMRVKIMGKMIDQDRFEAESIAPWFGQELKNERNHMQPRITR